MPQFIRSNDSFCYRIVTRTVAPTMAQILTLELESKAAQVREFLAQAVQEYGRVVYANSLGAEAMVLTDIIFNSVPQVDIVSIDTGRLHEETYDLLAKLQRRYNNRIRVIYPDGQEVSDLVTRQGINGFFDSSEARSACCGVRKVVPFRKFVEGYDAWITGVRRQQSSTRAEGLAIEWDAQNGLQKLSPLLDWTEEQVWAYIRARQLPFNTLHEKGYPSIGCAPCTRAIMPGEDHRAGRWWWERPEQRECGLHPKARTAALGLTGHLS
jgi:phosphoadenosine phosphosulfate reductase